MAEEGKDLLGFLLELDGGILLWIQEYLRGPLLNACFTFYTTLGNVGMIWIILSAGMLCFKKTRKAGVAGLVALLMGFVCTNLVLKPLVSRTRPWLVLQGLTTLVAEHDPHSFPSGHTCAAFAAVCAWRPHLNRRWGTVALVCAALMGFSRLYVGVHFPSDVLAGALIGALSGWLVSWIMSKQKK